MSAVQRDIQFLGEFVWVERAACKVAIANFEGRNLASPVISADDNFFRSRIFLDVHFVEVDSALFQERFGPSAIRAPACAVNRDCVHGVQGVPSGFARERRDTF